MSLALTNDKLPLRSF